MNLIKSIACTAMACAAIAPTSYAEGLSILEAKNSTDIMLTLELKDAQVTYAGEEGLTYIQDNTAAVAVMFDDYMQHFEVGTKVNATVEIQNYGDIFILPANADYNPEACDVSTGERVTNLADLEANLDYYRARLITINSADLPIAYQQDGYYMIDDKLQASYGFGLLPDDFKLYEELESITGLYIEMRSGWNTFMALNYRFQEDLVPMPELPLVENLSYVANLNEGDEFRLQLDEALVTYAAETGLTYLQDKTAAIKVNFTDSQSHFQKGTVVSGIVYATYENGTVVIDANLSFGSEDKDATTGETITSLDVLDKNPAYYANRLITIYADDLPIVLKNGAYEIGGQLLTAALLDPLGADFTLPENAVSITGILMNNTTKAGNWTLSYRDETDIVADSEQPSEDVAETFLDAYNAEKGESLVIRLNDAVVTFVDAEGFAYVEDTTAALVLIGKEKDTFMAGTSLKGEIKATFNGMGFTVADDATFEATGCDVTADETVATIEALENNPAYYSYRLVTFNADDLAIEKDGEGHYIIGDDVISLNLFGALPKDYQMPDKVKSITGVLMQYGYNQKGAKAASSDIPSWAVCMRSESDIVADTDAVSSIFEAQEGLEIFTITGIRVKATDMNSLPAGIYVVNGKKLINK